MTKQAFESAARYSLTSKNARYPEVIWALQRARILTPDSVLSNMSYQEQSQHLINIAWDIYQKETGIKQ